MLHIITPCSRPENLEIISKTIPLRSHWIVCADNKITNLTLPKNATLIKCQDTGFVGIKARNHVLDNFSFDDEDSILFHDDDNIIHSDLYNTIENLLLYDYSIMCWGQIFKDGRVRLQPPILPKVYRIDTACYLIKWKYNKKIRHKIDTYTHDGIYAEDCSKNGKIMTVHKYLAYYNYLR